jgi:hypothetical protein
MTTHSPFVAASAAGADRPLLTYRLAPGAAPLAEVPDGYRDLIAGHHGRGTRATRVIA